MNGVLNFSVLDGWWYEGYRFDEKAGWALTDKRTYTDQAQQDKLDAATIYSMLENEIVPLYFAKNSKGYSPEWVQYIKRSIGHIAPIFTMKRQLDDYIDRFYEPEARRFAKLAKNDFKLARDIVAWKENVASKWDSIQIISSEFHDDSNNNGVCRDICTYELKNQLREAGIYRFALRMYPKNVNLPHRQDFAYVRWF